MSVDTQITAQNILKERLITNPREPRFLEEEQQIEARFFGLEAQSTAIKERGESFIDAAILMINHGPPSKYALLIGEREKSIQKLEKIKAYWNTIEHGKASLYGLLKVLCNEVNKSVFNGQKDNSIVLDNLSNAENHVNWNQKKQSVETLVRLDDDTVQVRIDRPIMEFTKAQELEWQKILNPKKPEWFKKLELWEKNYFIDKISKWKNQGDVKNLGIFMGVPPTTIRGYPGARNCYESHIYTFKRDPKDRTKFLFEPTNYVRRIRSGHVSPSEMENRDERLKNSQANIEQLILAGVRNEVEAGKKHFLVDLQTLITPPLMPADNAMDLDRLNAIDTLRKKFSGDGFKEFLEKNGVKIPGKIAPQIELLTSNYPVNKGRAVSNFFAPLKPLFAHFYELPTLGNNIFKDPLALPKWLFSPFTEAWRGIKRARENNRVLSSLNNKIEELVGYGGKLTKEQEMAKAALEKIKDISGFQRIANFFTRGINHNAERAALEQIAVAGLGGIRIGKSNIKKLTLILSSVIGLLSKYILRVYEMNMRKW